MIFKERKRRILEGGYKEKLNVRNKLNNCIG